MSTKLRVRYDTTIEESETISSEMDENRESGYRVTRPVEQSIVVHDTFEGVCEVAGVIYTLADTNSKQFLWDFLDENFDTEEFGNPHGGKLTVESPIPVDAVYLAARKLAAEKTRKNMVRTGYSVEQVLMWWATGNSSFDLPGSTELVMENISDVASQALLAFSINHTPGGDIHTDGIPEYTHPDFVKEDMRPIETPKQD